MAENRLDREQETREKKTRKRAWTKPEVLPTPTPQEGYAFHWVRVSTRGQADKLDLIHTFTFDEAWAFSM